MAGYRNHAPRINSDELLHAQSQRQAELLGKVASGGLEGFIVSPSVADEFFARHDLGNLAVPLDNTEHIEVGELIATLRK